MTKPVLQPNSYSSTTSIRCELIVENDCKWSRDVHEMGMNYSKLSEVIELVNYVICMMKWCNIREFITDDHENNNEYANTSSSPSITPCIEANSLAIHCER